MRDIFFRDSLNLSLLALLCLWCWLIFRISFIKILARSLWLPHTLLVMVLIPSIGVERNYSQRWVRIGSFMFQPSEVVKLGMILYFVAMYAKK
ncbi:FtsW/RodA/SpoVE family cell cycle protein [Robertmurraya sp. FSL W8-0741]|uniref:FtsW/RodA/SpoVE family cell cycle protein n=1 Tax=Robertmurraya sp. FSL W8-0741 TaxID=2954629 RepID=UPI004046A25C